MLRVQTRVLSAIDVSTMDTDDVMFRVVDAAPLTPRIRVEMGFVFGGVPTLFSTMKVKDPDIVAKQLVEAYDKLQAHVDGVGR